jgi:hypothetical protein
MVGYAARSSELGGGAHVWRLGERLAKSEVGRDAGSEMYNFI